MLHLSFLDCLNGLLIDDNFVETRLDKPSSDMLNLFSCLNEEIVSRWNLNGNPIAGVSCPNVQSWVAGAAVDGQEV